MKMRILILSTFLLFSGVLSGQGIEFYDGNWKDALKVAEEKGKLVFVDAYAVWCGPCKMMAKNVFPRPEVGSYFNAHFVNMKIDMEKGQGLDFRKKYRVTAFPTFFFLAPDGKIVLQVKGARNPKDFVKLAESAVSKYDPSAEIAAEYESGKRDYETVYNYVKALNKAGKNSLAIANEYLKSQTDLTTPENLHFILEATTEADSRIFDMLVKHKDPIVQLTSEAAVNEKIRKACHKTVDKAMEFKLEMLLDEAIQKMKLNLPEESAAFAANGKMAYYKTTGEVEGYLAACKNYLQGNSKDAVRLNKIAGSIIENFGSNEDAMKYAAKLAKKACQYGDHSEYHYTFARILHAQGNKTDALKQLDQAIRLAKSQNGDTKDIFKLKETLMQS